MKGAKTLLIAGAVASIGLAGIVGGGLVSAESNSSRNSIVDKIASKFNLKKTDVQAVFDEDRTARQAERTADNSKRLQTAVDNGKITADQKKLIEVKLAEVEKARETERTTIEKWATDNKIDQKYIMGRGMMGGDNNRLSEAVTNGDITAAQKKLIEDKQAEIQKKHEADKTSLDQWAKDNNISNDYLRFGGGMGPGGHGGGMGMHQD